MPKVLILGGTGRIGRNVAIDLLARTSANLVLSGRNSDRGQKLCQTLGPRTQFLAVDFTDRPRLHTAISTADLVIHCAGPFLNRDARVLQECIENRIPYLDVSDSREFTELALTFHDLAVESGAVAIINSGIFPGISNSMVRQAVEQLDIPERIELSYVVSGSGGAGVTVMRTTFLGLLHPFDVWLDGSWQPVAPYSDRQTVSFPHYNEAAVYWFDVPETLTLPQSFPVRTVTTKFGSLPDLYNHLTWLTARACPPPILARPSAIEFLSQVSYAMTQISDRFTGVGVAIRAEVTGTLDACPARSVSTLYSKDTARAAGAGTGTIAAHLLSMHSPPPGVHPVERAISTEQFEQGMQESHLSIQLRCDRL